LPNPEAGNKLPVRKLPLNTLTPGFLILPVIFILEIVFPLAYKLLSPGKDAAKLPVKE